MSNITVVGKRDKLNGDLVLTDKASAVIHGTVTGNVVVQRTEARGGVLGFRIPFRKQHPVYVAPGGSVLGDIEANEVVVAGRVTGHITADRLVVKQGAEVTGGATVTELVVMGGLVHGQIHNPTMKPQGEPVTGHAIITDPSFISSQTLGERLVEVMNRTPLVGVLDTIARNKTSANTSTTDDCGQVFRTGRATSGDVVAQ